MFIGLYEECSGYYDIFCMNNKKFRIELYLIININM